MPGDANGNPLKPFAAAAADESVPLGTAFRVQDCGVDSSGGRIDGTICSRIMGASWTVVDRTTGKPSGSRELDLYIGDESHPDFQSSNPLDFSTVNARTTLR